MFKTCCKSVTLLTNVLIPFLPVPLILQEQLKFVYDTLEECVVCGYTYFSVKDLSHHLKQKSVKKTGRKTNEYEREYEVSKLVNQ